MNQKGTKPTTLNHPHQSYYKMTTPSQRPTISHIAKVFEKNLAHTSWEVSEVSRFNVHLGNDTETLWIEFHPEVKKSFRVITTPAGEVTPKDTTVSISDNGTVRQTFGPTVNHLPLELIARAVREVIVHYQAYGHEAVALDGSLLLPQHWRRKWWRF